MNIKSFILSPLSFLVLSWISILLLELDNPMNWVSSYNWSRHISYHIYIIYSISFYIGYKISIRKKYKVIFNDYDIKKVFFKIRYKLYIFVVLASFFHIAKFINIGDIPLLGNPMSRYNLTLGGYEDFPSRLLAPLGILLSLSYFYTKKKLDLFFYFFILILLAFLMQRQELANLLIGSILISIFVKKYKFKKVIKLILLLFIIVYLVVGVGTILRYGQDTLAKNTDILILPFWIIHAEFTSPIAFTESILENIGDNYLYGLYSFGIFISIIMPGFKMHGAELIRTSFTDKDTAQSLAAPLSYYVDFGIYGIIAIGLITGLLVTYAYRRAIITKHPFWMLYYTLLYLSLLWSLRAGVIIISPLLIYLLFPLLIIFNNFIRIHKNTKSAILLFYLFTLLISFIGLGIRI